jgi:hypothetical protein
MESRMPIAIITFTLVIFFYGKYFYNITYIRFLHGKLYYAYYSLWLFYIYIFCLHMQY